MKNRHSIKTVNKRQKEQTIGLKEGLTKWATKTGLHPYSNTPVIVLVYGVPPLGDAVSVNDVLPSGDTF